MRRRAMPLVPRPVATLRRTRRRVVARAVNRVAVAAVVIVIATITARTVAAGVAVGVVALHLRGAVVVTAGAIIDIVVGDAAGQAEQQARRKNQARFHGHPPSSRCAGSFRLRR